MPVKVSMQPALFTNHHGVRYAIAGSVWIEVPKNTTIKDIGKYMVYERPKSRRIAKGEKSWSVNGSKGSKYTVTLKNGLYSCTCRGFAFRRRCKHIEGIRNETR